MSTAEQKSELNSGAPELSSDFCSAVDIIILPPEKHQNNNQSKSQAVPKKDFVAYAFDEF